MDEKPLISVVISCYNYAKFLNDSIDSALNQSYSNIEVIVVNDGSTDNSHEIALGYGDKIRYFQHENAGLSYTKNFGANQAAGEYIAFLDADDIWRSDKLQCQMALFSNKTVSIVYSRRLAINENDLIQEIDKRSYSRGNITKDILFQNYICFSSVIIKTSTWKTYGGFDETLRRSSDFDFWLRTAPLEQFDYSDEPLVYYRSGHGNISANAEARLVTCEKLLQTHTSSPAYKDVDPKNIKQAFANLYFNWGYYKRQSSKTDALKLYIKSIKHGAPIVKVLRSSLRAIVC